MQTTKMGDVQRVRGIAISLLPLVLMTFESMYPKKKVQDYNGLFGLKREKGTIE